MGRDGSRKFYMEALEGPNILAALWSHWFPGFPVPTVLLTAWLIMVLLIVVALLAVR